MSHYVSVTRAGAVLCRPHAHPAPSHERLPGHQRELGPGREGRHGDDAQQNRTRRSSIQTLLRGTGRYGELASSSSVITNIHTNLTNISARSRQGLLSRLQLDSACVRWEAEPGHLAGGVAVRAQGQGGQQKGEAGHGDHWPPGENGAGLWSITDIVIVSAVWWFAGPGRAKYITPELPHCLRPSNKWQITLCRHLGHLATVSVSPGTETERDHLNVFISEHRYCHEYMLWYIFPLCYDCVCAVNWLFWH